MEEIEVLSPEKITKRIIENWLPYGTIIQICYIGILRFIMKNVELTFLKITLSVVLQMFAVWLTWKISNKKAFKSKSIYKNDIPEIMQKLTKFTIVVCIVSAIFSFSVINDAINEITNEMKERYNVLIKIYGEEVYNQQMELLLEPAKKQIYSEITMIQIASIVISLGMLIFEKNELLKYTVLVE